MSRPVTGPNEGVPMPTATPPLDESTQPEGRWERRRRRARRFTITIFFGFLLVVSPAFASCLRHAVVDSEVGVMMYGLPIFLGVFYLSPVLSVSTVVWGLGMRKARVRGEVVPFWERWCFRAIAAALAFVLWGLSAAYTHKGMACVGL